MTDAVQITRKGYWVVNGTNRASEPEAFQAAASAAVASPGQPVTVVPPAYEVVFTAPVVTAPTDPVTTDPVATDPTDPVTADPSIVVDFSATPAGMAVTLSDKSVGLPYAYAGKVDFGDGKIKTIYARATAQWTYATAGDYTITVSYVVDGVTYSASKVVTVPDGDPVASDPTTDPVTTDPTGSTSGNVYADALTGLTLPLASAWSDTRPDYSAQAKVTLADGVLIADTTKQAPDYVPYSGVWIYPMLQANGARHPDIALICYADRVTIGNVWLDASANYSGHHTITINGVVVQDVDARYDFATYTCPVRKGLPQPAARHDWDAKLLPNFGKVDGGYTSWASQLANADNGVNGRSLTTPGNGMGQAGDQFSIGIVPAYTIPWIVDGGAENFATMQQIEDHAWCWPVHLRDRVTGLPVVPCVEHLRDVTMVAQYIGETFASGHTNPVSITSASPLKPDNAHCPGFAIVPYLSTGAAADLEELIAWAGYESYYGNPVYRQYTKCISTGNVRAVAWQGRSKGYAAVLCPADHPMHADLLQVDANDAAYWTAKHCNGGENANPYGIFGGAATFVYRLAMHERIGMAMWQQDYLVATIHQKRRMGLPGWDQLGDFLNTFTKGRFGDGSPGTGWRTMAGFYDFCPVKVPGPDGRSSPSAVTADYLASWDEIVTNTLQWAYAAPNDATAVGRYADQIGKTMNEADFGAGPGVPKSATSSPSDYYAYSQAGVAAAADDGITAPWTWYAANILPVKNFANEGQWNIVPEAV